MDAYSKRELLTLGEKRQMTVTKADKLMANDILMILSSIWLAVPKNRGTKASHMTQVVYIVNPMCWLSLKSSGILRVSTAYTVHTIMSIIGYANEHMYDVSKWEEHTRTFSSGVGYMCIARGGDTTIHIKSNKTCKQKKKNHKNALVYQFHDDCILLHRPKCQIGP